MIESDPFLGADSWDRAELITQGGKEAIDIKIPNNDAEKIRTIHRAIELIEKLIAAQDPKEAAEPTNEAVAVAVTSHNSEERPWPQ